MKHFYTPENIRKPYGFLMYLYTWNKWIEKLQSFICD